MQIPLRGEGEGVERRAKSEEKTSCGISLSNKKGVISFVSGLETGALNAAFVSVTS